MNNPTSPFEIGLRPEIRWRCSADSAEPFSGAWNFTDLTALLIATVAQPAEVPKRASTRQRWDRDLSGTVSQGSHAEGAVDGGARDFFAAFAPLREVLRFVRLNLKFITASNHEPRPLTSQKTGSHAMAQSSQRKSQGSYCLYTAACVTCTHWPIFRVRHSFF